MCGLKRLRYVGGDPDSLVHGKLMFSVELLPEALPLHIGHHVKQEPVCIPGVVEWQDVRVLEVGCGFDLGQETLGADQGGQLGLQNLEGDLALMLQVIGQIDRGHATFAELALTVEVVQRMESSPSGVRQLSRRLKTSPAQIYRLLDPTNYKKTVDKLLELLHVLDAKVEVRVV